MKEGMSHGFDGHFAKTLFSRIRYVVRLFVRSERLRDRGDDDVGGHGHKYDDRERSA